MNKHSALCARRSIVKREKEKNKAVTNRLGCDKSETCRTRMASVADDKAIATLVKGARIGGTGSGYLIATGLVRLLAERDSMR